MTLNRYDQPVAQMQRLEMYTNIQVNEDTDISLTVWDKITNRTVP